MKPKINKMPKIVRLLLFILLILAPLLILMLVFTPMANKKSKETILSYYRLPANFTEEHIRQNIEKMRRDPEFRFYFGHLDVNNVESAILEVSELLTEERSANAIYASIKKQQDKVMAKATLFNSLNYPNDYTPMSDEYPQLTDLLWNFLYEEFKLVTMGVCYKATYDNDFTLQYNESSREAASKLKLLLKTVEN